MKILQTIAGFGIKSGGTSTCTYDLLTALHKVGFNADLLTLDVNSLDNKLMGDGEQWIKLLPYDSLTPYGYSPSLKHFLYMQNDYSLYHTHGLWMYCNHITCKAAREKGLPYIITPHGMLYPQALKHSYWKKWILMQMLFNKDIYSATCVHVTCKQEMDHIRNFGYNGLVAIIPNPINTPLYINEIKRKKGSARFGFLGRLHPIKRVEQIIYAAALLKKQERDFEILIIGKGDAKYEQFLRSETTRLHLSNVQFLGFIDGREKYEQLASLSTLFVPSYSENFGMIIPEALSVGTPVMASLGTPWEELNIRKCGWWEECSPENIAKIMDIILNMTSEQLNEMGNQGKLLIKESYTAEKATEKMINLYTWILNGGEKPEFVYE